MGGRGVGCSLLFGFILWVIQNDSLVWMKWSPLKRLIGKGKRRNIPLRPSIEQNVISAPLAWLRQSWKVSSDLAIRLQILLCPHILYLWDNHILWFTRKGTGKVVAFPMFPSRIKGAGCTREPFWHCSNLQFGDGCFTPSIFLPKLRLRICRNEDTAKQRQKKWFLCHTGGLIKLKFFPRQE